MRRLLAIVLLGSAILTPSPARGGGRLLWHEQFDFAGGRDNAVAIAAAHARVVAVGNATTADGNSDFVVRAYDAEAGTLLWGDRVDIAGGLDSALAVVMNGARVVVAGTTREDASSNAGTGLIRTYVAKTGALAWKDEWPGAFGLGLAMAGSWTVVAGRFVEAGGVGQLRVRAYVTKSGAVAWEDKSPLPAGYVDISVPSRGVTIEGQRMYMAASVRHHSTPGLGGACLVRAYDIETGDLLWQVVRDVPSRCGPLAVATDGRRVVLAGLGGVGGDHWLVQAYDAATGEFLWQDGLFGGIINTNAMVALDTAGRRTFVTGWRAFGNVPFPSHEAFVVRSYDTLTGALRWEREHQSELNGPFHWHGHDVDVASGRVFAVGQEVEGLSTWLVRAYDARRGDVLWEDEFQPPGAFSNAGLSQALVVAGGRLFVAGSGHNAAGNVDFIVRAYDAR